MAAVSSNPSPTTWTYCSNTDDFGIVIQKLLFARWGGALPNTHFQSNMIEIAKEEGFELIFAKEGIMPRDVWLKTSTGKVALPSRSPSIPDAIDINESLSFVTNNKAAFRTQHIFFNTYLGTVYDQLGSFPVPKKTSQMPFYLEGGNCYRATNAHGVQKLLIGKDSFSVAFIHQCLDGSFLLDKRSLKDVSPLSEDKFQKIANEMYAQGFLSSVDGYVSESEMIEVIDQLRQESKGSSLVAFALQNKAIELGIHKPLEASLKERKETRRRARCYYEVRRRIKAQLVKMLLPKGGSSENLLILPQMGYHLDTFMKPGPKGSLFLQDYQATYNFLKEIVKDQEPLKLTAGDLEILKRYMVTAERLSEELGDLFLKTRKKLEKAGFIVISTPGVFFDISPNDQSTFKKEHETCPKFNVNFLNSITGWSEKQKHYYWIASGAMVQDHLGSVLMDSFEKFLLKYVPNLKVYFIGYNPKNPKDFSEAMDLWNHPEAMAGPHCFSLERKTASHDEVLDSLC